MATRVLAKRTKATDKQPAAATNGNKQNKSKFLISHLPFCSFAFFSPTLSHHSVLLARFAKLKSSSSYKS